MSGGSYSYLCYQDGDALLGREQDVADMLERLEGLDYAACVADETREVLALIRQVQVIRDKLTARSRKLSKVWHAVEWWDSGDYGEDEVRRVVADWSKGRIPNASQR